MEEKKCTKGISYFLKNKKGMLPGNYESENLLRNWRE